MVLSDITVDLVELVPGIFDKPAGLADIGQLGRQLEQAELPS